MGRRENITDPSDAKATLVHFCQYFAYPDFLYHYIHCYLLCCHIILQDSSASQDQSLSHLPRVQE